VITSVDDWPGNWYNGYVTLAWIAHNWFAFAQTGLLASGLFLIGIAILLEARARRVANLIKLTQQHRDLWERMYSQPELDRIIDPNADIAKTGVTAEEEIFASFIILHLSTTYFAIRSGFFQKPTALGRDIEDFFSLPVPRAVWEKLKNFQEPRFVSFVERYLPNRNLSDE